MSDRVRRSCFRDFLVKSSLIQGVSMPKIHGLLFILEVKEKQRCHLTNPSSINLSEDSTLSSPIRITKSAWMLWESSAGEACPSVLQSWSLSTHPTTLKPIERMREDTCSNGFVKTQSSSSPSTSGAFSLQPLSEDLVFKNWTFVRRGRRVSRG